MAGGDRGRAAREAAEGAARLSYGRLVALLAGSTGDLALAEDALSEAFGSALRTWPRSGVPDNPDGWLLTAARNRIRDVWRSSAHRTAADLEEADHVAAVDPFADLDPDAIGDRRVALLFACSHPDVDVGARTPLMLQVVLGFEAADIARAYAVPSATMAQRLVRAKARIRARGVPFEVPGPGQLADRVPAVLEALHGCYALTWHGAAGDAVHTSVAAEARRLAVATAELLDDDPEAWGLAASITFGVARAGGRAVGWYVPLDEQDPDRWDAALIAEAEGYLRRASALGRTGRFQLEAAIEAVHASRIRSDRIDWAALGTLHLALVHLAPTLGSRVALAAVLGSTDGPNVGLAAIDALGSAADEFQPAWATRAHLLVAAGDHRAARQAYDRAIALSDDGAVIAWLRARRDAVG
ncbi:RNA polymerase sigma factor [Euzebya sp.]|uniref:RNA polymerase sigma factor n=1 Tax=Euzebya sp. TaxID=1971409 RepID=UPI0035161BC2